MKSSISYVIQIKHKYIIKDRPNIHITEEAREEETFKKRYGERRTLRERMTRGRKKKDRE